MEAESRIFVEFDSPSNLSPDGLATMVIARELGEVVMLLEVEVGEQGALLEILAMAAFLREGGSGHSSGGHHMVKIVVRNGDRKWRRLDARRSPVLVVLLLLRFVVYDSLCLREEDPGEVDVVTAMSLNP